MKMFRSTSPIPISVIHRIGAAVSEFLVTIFTDEVSKVPKSDVFDGSILLGNLCKLIVMKLPAMHLSLDQQHICKEIQVSLIVGDESS